MDSAFLRENWSSFLENYDPGNLPQSWGSGELAKTIYPGAKIVRLLLKMKDEPVGLVQCRYQKSSIFGAVLYAGNAHGNGPVVANLANKQHIFGELIATLDRQAIKFGVYETLIHQGPEMHKVLENMGYTILKCYNFYKIDLSNNSNDLWKAIDHNKRRNIRKAIKQGVEVVQSTSEDDLITFYELHKISHRRARFTIESFNYYQELFEAYGKIGKAKIFMALFKGVPIAGVFVVFQGNTAHSLGGGSNPETWKLRPNDLLHWKIMEDACCKNIRYYHMGVVPEPVGGSLWRWKKEWNGHLERTSAYHKLYMPKFSKFVLAPYYRIRSIVHRAK